MKQRKNKYVIKKKYKLKETRGHRLIHRAQTSGNSGNPDPATFSSFGLEFLRDQSISS